MQTDRTWQLILEVEADLGGSSFPGSLMDRVLVGIIALCGELPVTQSRVSDHILDARDKPR
jgi:nucleolar protein 9